MKTMKRLFGVVLMMMVSMVVSAQTDQNSPEEAQTTQVKVDISSFQGGVITEKEQTRNVTKNDKDEEIVTYAVTITVTPDEGYYITKDDIVVMATYPLKPKDPTVTRGEGDEAEQQIPELGGRLELVGEDPEDLNTERDYTFTVEDGYGAWVMEARFHSSELVLGSDVTEIADNSLGGVTSIVIENGNKVISLGDNDVKGVKVVVPGNLYNEYKTTEGWSEAEITVDESQSVKMEGVSFTEKNDYTAFFSKDPLVVPSLLQAFTVNGITKEGMLIINNVGSVIPAGEPVLLFSQEVDDDLFYTVPESVGKSDEKVGKTRAAEVKNALQVVTDDTKTDENGLYVELGQVYILYNDVFYYTQAGYIPVGGIYLDPKALEVVDVDEGDDQKEQVVKTRSFFTIGDDNTTAINASRLSPLTSHLSGAWYSLDGRRLSSAPTRKGIYIHNGQKTLIK